MEDFRRRKLIWKAKLINFQVTTDEVKES